MEYVSDNPSNKLDLDSVIGGKEIGAGGATEFVFLEFKPGKNEFNDTFWIPVGGIPDAFAIGKSFGFIFLILTE